jgi:hypothetical protein
VIRPRFDALALAAALLAPPQVAGQASSFPKDYFDSVVVEQTARHGVDYAAAYRAAARRNAKGLATLFRATLLTDGVGGEQHSAILWRELQLWGDSAFARVLRAQPDTVRAGVRCALDFAACTDWASRYPLTARLAAQNPNCVCN